MTDHNKVAILNYINNNATSGTPVRLNFNSLGKTLKLTKQDFDICLVELNEQRFISQYAKKGVDSFTVVINQKGLDALHDASFI